VVGLSITKLRNVYSESASEKILKSVSIWQSYKQEGGYFWQFVCLATTLLKVEENALHNLPFCPYLCQIFTDIKKIHW